jgi:ribonuclease PH
VARPDTDADAASIDAAYTAFANANYNVRDLLVGVTTSRTFRFRSPSPGEVLP